MAFLGSFFSWSPKQACYCAFCRTPRTVYTRRRAGAFHLIGALAVGAALMVSLEGRSFNGLYLNLGLALFFVLDIFYRLRWRMKIVCQVCGFDPLVYLRNPDNAATRVRTRLDQRRQRADYLLLKPLNLPYRSDLIPSDSSLVVSNAANSSDKVEISR